MGCSVHTRCDVATLKKMNVGEGFIRWGVGKVSVESASVQLYKPMSEPQHSISCPSVASQVGGKMPELNTFSGDPTQKGEVSLSNGLSR